MLCTECKKKQEKRIPNDEKENAQPTEKVCSDVHTTLKSKRSAALILVTGATLMLIMVFILFWLIMLPNLPQDNSVLANNCANICQTAKEYIGIWCSSRSAPAFGREFFCFMAILQAFYGTCIDIIFVWRYNNTVWYKMPFLR